MTATGVVDRPNVAIAESGISGSGTACDIDRVQRVRLLPVLWRDLHDDAVLVESGIDRRHLTLTERVVQRLIDGVGADAEPGGRVPIDSDAHVESAVLLIAVDVGDQRLLSQSSREPRAPRVQRRHVVTLKRVLVLGVGLSAAHPDVLCRLQVDACTRIVRERRAQSGRSPDRRSRAAAAAASTTRTASPGSLSRCRRPTATTVSIAGSRRSTAASSATICRIA